MNVLGGFSKAVKKALIVHVKGLEWMIWFVGIDFKITLYRLWSDTLLVVHVILSCDGCDGIGSKSVFYPIDHYFKCS